MEKNQSHTMQGSSNPLNTYNNKYDYVSSSHMISQIKDQLSGRTESGLYYYGARYYDPRISVWMSVDPMAKKYPSYSSYSYCINNPVIIIDYDGRDIIIITGRDSKGMVTGQLKYKNGSLYQVNGKPYSGDHKFANEVKKTLNELKSLNDSEVNNVINTLENSKQAHYIELDPYEANRAPSTDSYAADNGKPTGTHILLDLTKSIIEKNLKSNPLTLLIHELSHAFDNDQGNRKNEVMIPSTADNPGEKRAVKLENRVRKLLKIENRKTYGGKKI